MARTKGAKNKVKYFRIPFHKMKEQFADNAVVYLSVEHHGAAFGVDKNTAPRKRTVMLADGPMVIASVNPVEDPSVIPVAV